MYMEGKGWVEKMRKEWRNTREMRNGNQPKTGQRLVTRDREEWQVWARTQGGSVYTVVFYSVSYRIIFKRRCGLPLTCSLEKSQVTIESWHWYISSLSCGSMKFLWWKLKMSYHTVHTSWDCPAQLCLPFVSVSFLKEDLQFWKLFKKTICKGVCTFKCTEKLFFNQE